MGKLPLLIDDVKFNCCERKFKWTLPHHRQKEKQNRQKKMSQCVRINKQTKLKSITTPKILSNYCLRRLITCACMSDRLSCGHCGMCAMCNFRLKILWSVERSRYSGPIEWFRCGRGREQERASGERHTISCNKVIVGISFFFRLKWQIMKCFWEEEDAIHSIAHRWDCAKME